MTIQLPSLVLFDLDDTVLAHREAVDHGITVHRASLKGTGFEADDASEIGRWQALEEQHYHRYLSGELDFRGQRVARVQDFVAAYGIDLDETQAERWYDDYYLEYEKAWELHEDTLPCLDELSRTIPGVQFGLITNGELAYQSLKVTATGLDQHTGHVIASGELGIAKPDARIFQHACALFDVPPAAAVYVGDRLQTDAIGASRAGLTGVWLDRHDTATNEDLAAAAAANVVVIRTLQELPAVLTGGTS